jgi:hypothetical protein
MYPVVSQLQIQLFFKHKDYLCDADYSRGCDADLFRRYAYTKPSRGNPIHDIYEIDKYLFNGVDLCALTSIETTPMYKVLITEVVYKVFTVKVGPVVLLNRVKQHESTPALYYFRSSEVKMNTIPKSSAQFRSKI